MIKDDNKKEKMKKIIRENPDKTLNELKNMAKGILPNEEREQFTFEDLTKLISEINQERENQIQKVFSQKRNSSRRTQNTRNIEGEER